MCGIAGIFAFSDNAPMPREVELLAARDRMSSRGPDGAGLWWDESRRVGLAHRRLSIIDLTDAASQPMTDGRGRTIVFNGEIYNFHALRTDLETEGYRFRTTSDTEVLLALYASRGPAMVEALRGMYAFAIWDEARRGLLLARDPYGIKPLYYSNDGKTLRFASQVKALLSGGARRDIDPAGVVGFHIFGSVPEPYTLYSAISPLPAGSTMWIDRAGAAEPRQLVSIAAVLAEASQQRPSRDLADVVREAMLDSVRHHLVADVEVGAFLSSGIDSGALVGLMRDAGQKRIRTITLGFEEFRNTHGDEAPLAAEVAKLYQTDHHQRMVGRDEFEADQHLIIEAMDQPSIDGVNTWFVSKAARQLGLKVALSGVGGDEILAGYSTFREVPRWHRWLRGPLGSPALTAFAQVLLKASGVSRSHPKAVGLLDHGRSFSGTYLVRRAVLLPEEVAEAIDPDMARVGLERLRPFGLMERGMSPDPKSPTARVCALESTFYLRNQLLRDTDWAGMAHSLEIRTPLVDIGVLTALAPYLSSMTGEAGKRALANAPSQPLPAAVVQRRKSGFAVPTAIWRPSEAGAANTRLTSRRHAGEILKQFTASTTGARA